MGQNCPKSDKTKGMNRKEKLLGKREAKRFMNKHFSAGKKIQNLGQITHCDAILFQMQKKIANFLGNFLR